MRTIVAILALAIAATPTTGLAQTRSDVVGTWKLVSIVSTDARGARVDSVYGDAPVGFLTYTADGRMHAIISHGGRKPLSRDDRIAAPAEERAAAFATFLAYAGRFSVATGKVVHHVEVASVQNWVGTDLVRTLTIDHGRLVLRTPPLSQSGRTQTVELVWERVK